jgi:hypothetical protein
MDVDDAVVDPGAAAVKPKQRFILTSATPYTLHVSASDAAIRIDGLFLALE